MDTDRSKTFNCVDYKMITHSMSPEERLRDWKSFRESLTCSLSDIEILQKVVEYWMTVPYLKFYLDFDKLQTWPNPWELVHSGEFCSTGIAYLMFKTLELCPAKRWQNSEIKIMRIKDLEIEDFFMVVVIKSTYVLNYFYGSVGNISDLQSNCEIICEYDCNEL